MAFQNQFALTVELTRLLPPIGRATNEAAKAIITRARELRHSGSDIVVEEDLVNVFGRCRISDSLTSSFKTVVTSSHANISLIEGIMLQGGPGPTVIRAFQEKPYFAMLVQLSLLAWTFQDINLATAIADALRKRSEGGPSSSTLQNTPDMRGILGTLHACESQTSAFNWNLMLDAVSTTLGYDPDKARMDFPEHVLRGLLDMFPMVQTLPKDRLISIKIPVRNYLASGVSALVVWAHHVLDLTVLVQPRRISGQSSKSFRFGRSDFEQVIIEEVNSDEEATLIMLDSHREHLLTIKPEPDAESTLIGSVRRRAAKGWGNALIVDSIDGLSVFQMSRVKIILQELQKVTFAFALIIAQHMIKDDKGPGKQEKEGTNKDDLLYGMDEERLLQATRFLFDNTQISRREIDGLAEQYSWKALDGELPLPLALDAAVRDASATRGIVVGDEWNDVCSDLRSLSILLLALANVADLEDCQDLMFTGLAFGSMSNHGLARQLEVWNGRDSLRISDDAWLQALAVPLVGHRSDVWKLPWGQVCLISDRCWSVWISTLQEMDPGYTNAGSVRLGRGSPCRNGVWKMGIWDTSHGIYLNGSFPFATDPQKAEIRGQIASLRCTNKVTMDSPYCGESEDMFLICARLRLPNIMPGQRSVVRTGYADLHTRLWRAHLSRMCTHGSDGGGDVTLAPECATVTGFGYHLADASERVLIHLTAGSPGARWLALLTLPSVTVKVGGEEEDIGLRQILLRDMGCCFQCTVDQAAMKPGKWFVIL